MCQQTSLLPSNVPKATAIECAKSNNHYNQLCQKPSLLPSNVQNAITIAINVPKDIAIKCAKSHHLTIAINALQCKTWPSNLPKDTAKVVNNIYQTKQDKLLQTMSSEQAGLLAGGGLGVGKTKINIHTRPLISNHH